ncbi:MAG: hypothetical protein SOH65_06805, partial [Bifidobacterium sp.]
MVVWTWVRIMSTGHSGWVIVVEGNSEQGDKGRGAQADGDPGIREWCVPTRRDTACGPANVLETRTLWTRERPENPNVLDPRTPRTRGSSVSCSPPYSSLTGAMLSRNPFARSVVGDVKKS